MQQIGWKLSMIKNNSSFKQKLKNKIKFITAYIAALYIAVMGAAVIAIPDSLTYFKDSEYFAASNIADKVSSYTGTLSAEAKLFGTIPVKNVSIEILPETKLMPVGDIFGVKFFTKGVIIIGTTDVESSDGFVNPAQIAGLSKNDIITKVNGHEINTVEALAKVIEDSAGKALNVEYTSAGETHTCKLTPVLSKADNKYKSGIWVRDSTAGIGTVTYYNPETGCFAGLGHGICDVDTGELMPLLRGIVVDVSISEVVKGKSGIPGELKGIFSHQKKGTLIGNTKAGVYGILDSAPASCSAAVSVAGREEVKEGPAVILSNPDGKGVKEYDIVLSKVNRHSDGTKCFVVEITDTELLELTGGIVQGMSGSPIIQNGKLIGAVTHVLVNDPTKGYGIFIENMLEAAQSVA